MPKSKEEPKWEWVTDSVSRVEVPGGWLYMVGAALAFVPDPDAAVDQAEPLTRSMMQEFDALKGGEL